MEQKPKLEGRFLAMGLGLGVAFLAAFGLILDNLALGIPVGMLFGVALGVALSTMAARR
jgi:hypothetical protein